MTIVEVFKALTDNLRLRIIALLMKKELCVCQLMGITGASQPLISRNLQILKKSGLLEERREGKLKYYRINRGLTPEKRMILEAVKISLEDEPIVKKDLENLKECTEFQKRTGRCDMKTFKEFLKRKGVDL